MPGAAIMIFADCLNRRIKSLVSDISDMGDLIRQHSPSVPIPAILYAHCCKSPDRLGDFYHMTFQSSGQQRCLEPGNKIEVANRRDWRSKSPSVPASINGEIHSRYSLAIKIS